MHACGATKASSPANVANIVIDCGHDDWTWIDGEKTAGVVGTPQYGQFPTTAPTSIPNPLTNTPGARYGATGWTDKFGNLFLFGGTGFELTGNTTPDTLNAPLQDMWVCVAFQNGCEWQLVGGYDATPVGGGTNPPTVGSLISRLRSTRARSAAQSLQAALALRHGPIQAGISGSSADQRAVRPAQTS